MNYRTDIDGLRALAVISVILFLPNRNLEVNFFFVLSAFYIYSIGGVIKDCPSCEIRKEDTDTYFENV